VNVFERRLVRTAHPTVDAVGQAGGRVRRAHHFKQRNGTTASKIAEPVDFSTTLLNRHSGDLSQLELLEITFHYHTVGNYRLYYERFGA